MALVGIYITKYTKILLQEFAQLWQLRRWALFWFVLGLGLMSFVQDLVRYELNSWSSLHLAISLIFDAIGLIAMVYAVKNGGRWGYGALMLIAGVMAYIDISQVVFHIYQSQLYGQHAVWGVYGYGLLVDPIELLFAVPTFFFSMHYLRFGHMQEKRTKGMSEKELLEGYLISRRSAYNYGQNVSRKYQKRAKQLYLDAAWNRFEIKQRFPETLTMLNKFDIGEPARQDEVYKEFEKRFGAEALKPMLNSWQPPSLD